MLDRAAGTPIRVASKSVRVRPVLDAVLACPAITACSPTRCPRRSGLPRTSRMWWSGTRRSTATIRALASDALAAARVHPHGRLRRASRPHRLGGTRKPPGAHPGRGRAGRGVLIRGPRAHRGLALARQHATQAAALARTIIERPGFRAGRPHGLRVAARRGRRPPAAGGPVRRSLVETMQRGSRSELLERRAAVVVAAVRRSPSWSS